MISRACLTVATFTMLMLAATSRAEVKIIAEHEGNDAATADFKFKSVPSPSRRDAASVAKFIVVDGRRDPNGGDLDQLHDGNLPAEADEPAANFFFGAGTEGGRLLVDLGGTITIKRINSYTWHANTRGPQVYQLYGAEGSGDNFSSQPKSGTAPEACGWKLIAKVDTRPQEGDGGGQHGVSIFDPEGAIGAYRYLLFDISRTESRDPFGNTFYGEIDVDDGIEREVAATSATEPRREIVEADGGYQITIDTTETPDLTEWAHTELAPVVRAWYPKLVAMLPSEGYEAPKRVSIVFSRTMRGVAATGGTRVRCAAAWFRQNLEGEAKGAVVHELVHVVQQYGRARRGNANAAPTPGWLVEGIADYIRWFLHEPETRGAEVTERSLSRARYDAGYRISGNFLNWVTAKHDKEIVRKLNAAAREGAYSEDLWKTHTGHTVQELGEQWKAELARNLERK